MQRAMCSTLLDHSINPYDDEACIRQLLLSGFDAANINLCLSDAQLMAAMRLAQEGRRHERA